MTEQAARTKEIFAALLAEERSPAERLASLRALQDFLGDEDVALMLGSMAREEKTLEVRTAMVRAFLDVNVTRFVRKEAYLDHVFFFALSDPESTVRLAALEQLTGLVSFDDRIQNVFSETLLYDLDDEIQGTCLAGLAGCPRITEGTLHALTVYAATAPSALRGPLLDIFFRMERPYCEQGMLSLLHPMETVTIREKILDRLMAFPLLSGTVARYLVSYLPREPDAGLQEKVVKILYNEVQADEGLQKTVLDQIRASQDKRAMLFAFRDRLFSFPAMVDGLCQLFTGASSSGLKIDILRLLEPTENTPLFTAALSDPGCWVRFEAIGICERHLPGHEAAISSAVITCIPKEPLPGLREMLVHLLEKTGRRPSEVERFLLQWMVQETSPVIAGQIAAALPGIVMTDDNRQDLLNAFVTVLREPFYTKEIKDAITSRLTAFSFQDHPDLAECLKALLVRATDIREVEPLHRALRTLEPDPGKNIDLIRLLFLRFIGEYPVDPLPLWVRDFEALAPVNESVRREIPSIVRLTGETWILGTADMQDQKENLLQAILDALYKGAFHEPERLLEEAYRERTLRKRDLSALYFRLLDHHDQYRLLDNVLQIMTEARICSPEILDAGFRFINLFPDSSATYSVMSYLEKIGPTDPSYPDRIRIAMTPENYRTFCLNNTSPVDENRVPAYWDDSGHWRLPYPDWPVARLFSIPELAESRRQILFSPPDPAVPVRESLQYLLLYILWRSGPVGREDLVAIGRLMQSARTVTGYEALFERAVFTFSNCWPSFVSDLGVNTVPAELAASAASAFAEQCRQWHDLGSNDLRLVPMPLTGMDLAMFEAAWAPGDAVWDQLWTSLGSWFDEPAQGISFRSQETAVLHLRFFPVRDAYQLIQFLVLTPVPDKPAWERRWRDLLQKASRRYGPVVTRAVAQVPEPGRERLLSFLKET
jgi:hypothetical protein